MALAFVFKWKNHFVMLQYVSTFYLSEAAYTWVFVSDQWCGLMQIPYWSLLSACLVLGGSVPGFVKHELASSLWEINQNETPF